MNTGELFFVAMIVAWGIFEYRRREREHSKRMAQIREGVESFEVPTPPSLVKPMIVGIAAVLLGTAIVGFLVIGPSIRYGGVALALLAGYFFSILLVLLLILRRDLRAYLHSHSR